MLLRILRGILPQQHSLDTVTVRLYESQRFPYCPKEIVNNANTVLQIKLENETRHSIPSSWQIKF